MLDIKEGLPSLLLRVLDGKGTVSYEVDICVEVNSFFFWGVFGQFRRISDISDLIV